MAEIKFSYGETSENARVDQLSAPSFRDMCEGFLSRFPETDADLSDDKQYAFLKAHLPYITADCEGGERNNASAQPRRWLPIDVDKNCSTRDLIMIKRKLRGLAHCFYTTAGDNRRGDDQRRFRVLVELSREVEHHELPFIGEQFTATLSDSVEFDASVWKASQPIYAGIHGGQAFFSEGEPLDADRYGPAPVREHTRASNREIQTDGSFLELLDELAIETDKGYKLESYRTDYSSPTSKDDILIMPPVKGKFDQWRIEWLHDTDKRDIKRGHDMYSVLATCGYEQLALAMKRENHRINQSNRYVTDATPEFKRGSDTPPAEDTDPVADARAELLRAVENNPLEKGWTVDTDTGEVKHDGGRKNLKGPVAAAAIKLQAAIAQAYRAHLKALGFPDYPSWLVVGKKKTTLAAAGVIAQDIARAWNGRLRYDPGLRRSDQRSYGFVRYEAGRWVEFARFGAHIVESIERETSAPDAHTVDQIAAALTMRLETMPEVQPNLIAFRNGTLNVRTGQFMSHNPDHGLRSAMDIDYDPAGRTQPSTFLAWIDQISQGDEDLRMVMLAGLYYVLGSFASYKCFVELVGPPNGGKSVYANLCAALVGGEVNVLATDLDALNRDQHALASYETSRMVYIPETDGGKARSRKIKQLTGGDTVRIRPMGAAAYSVKANASVLLAGNKPVEWDDTSEGLNVRRVIIPFDFVVPYEDRILDFDKLVIAELPEIISYLVDTFPEGSKAELDFWRNHSDRAKEIARESDPIAEFAALLEVTDKWLVVGGKLRDKDPNGPKPTKNLRHAFDIWAELQNYDVRFIKTRDFKNRLLVELKRFGIEYESRVNARYLEVRLRCPSEYLS